MYSRLIIISLCIVGGSYLSHAQLYLDALIYIDDNAILYADADIILPSNNAEVIYSGELRTSKSISKDDNALLSYTTEGEGERVISIISNDNSNSHHIQGSLSDNNSIYNLVIDLENNEQTVDINSEIHIENKLTIINGILRTDTLSYENDGNLYDHKVVILNPSSESLEVTSSIDETGPYIEGKLERKMTSGIYEFPIGISNTTLAKQPIVIETTYGDNKNVTLYFQEGATSNLDLEADCDLGESPDYDQPDGSIEQIEIDCVFGQWIPESTSDFIHKVTLYPSSDLSNLCSEALLWYGAIGGTIENCPSFTSDNSIIRSNVQDFQQVYDIATASLSGISTSTIDVEGSLITTTIYPNPSIGSDDIYLDIAGDTNAEMSFEIFSTIGEKIVEKTPLNSGTNTLNVSSLINGHYIVRIRIGTITTSELIFIR